MLVIIGIVVVLLSVVGGYIMETRKPVGIVSTRRDSHHHRRGPGIIPHRLSRSRLSNAPRRGIREVFGKGESPEEFYIKILQLLFDLLSILRKDGAVALEDHINKPDKSAIFARFPEIVEDPLVRDFVCRQFQNHVCRQGRTL